MARHVTDGNLVTDRATGLTYFKDMAKVIPGFTGVVGADHGEWNANLGAIALRDIAYVAPTQAFAVGTQMAQGRPYANPEAGWWEPHGDNKWYTAKQTYTPNAYRPGMDANWSTKWSEVAWFDNAAEMAYSVSDVRLSMEDWSVYRCWSGYTGNARKPGVSAGWSTYWTAVMAVWEGQEGITYSVGEYRWYPQLTSTNGLFRCTSGYTTGSNPDNPSVDTTHWENVPVGTTSNWSVGTSYSQYDLMHLDGTWYLCISAHTSGVTDPSSDATHWEAVTTPEEWTEDQAWSLEDLAATWGTPYICISAHTGTYHRPENDADESHWSLIEPVPRTTVNQYQQTEMTALYYFCIQSHTAASDKYLGHSTYWRVFDKRWYEWWLSIVPGSGMNGYLFNPTAAGVLSNLSEVLDAIDYLNAGNGTDGQKDWRLPNEFEARVTRCFEDGKLWEGLSPPSKPGMQTCYGGPQWVVAFAYWTGTPCKPGDGSNVYAVIIEGLYHSSPGWGWDSPPQRKALSTIECRPAVTDRYAMAPEGCPVVFIARPVRGGVIQS